MKKIILYGVLFFLSFDIPVHADEDPWAQLQEKLKEVEVIEKPAPPKEDPWKKLREVFLPFSSEEEDQAVLYPAVAKTVAEKMNQRLSQYEAIIGKASNTFDIPKALIKAVIMAESGGNSQAKAGITSARGLMQTIKSTFKMARKGLSDKGIQILNDPFDPEASIMAGSWYLDRMYQKTVTDKKIMVSKRRDISSWRYALEYYYAGPSNGAKVENKIFVFSNGTKRVIDKRAYSKKIQNWANILEQA